MAGYFVRSGMNAVNPSVVNIRCPYCRHQGIFQGAEKVQDLLWFQNEKGASENSKVGGIRLCPNRRCRGIIFVVISRITGEVDAFPPETIDFDASNLPDNILSTLEEAVKCHSAGCYKASAIMVRRLLEELCKDRNAKGNTLAERIRNLSASVILPPDLLAATEYLRLLGNDAVHVEAKTYDNIGKSEVEAALDLSKEVLKAVYQYSTLLDKLRALKTPKP